LRLLVQAYKKLALVSLKSDIEKATTKLEKQISKWRGEQFVFMPHVALWANRQDNEQENCGVEKEVLHLPSDFDAGARADHHLITMAEMEAKLREGAAFDALKKTKVCAQAVTTLRDWKRKNISGVAQATTSVKQIQDAERRRDLHIALYMLARKAMMKLGHATGEEGDFPVLTEADTFLKSRATRRQLGDSRRTDGAIWAQGAVSVSSKLPSYMAPGLSSPSTTLDSSQGRTQMVKRATGM
jgi:hypothetical protein